MQNRIYKEDKGQEFGTWPDKVSRLMYAGIMPIVLSQIELPNNIADYGGANGLLKEYIPNATSIDIDPSKKPDIVDNIILHKGKYDLVFMRYVLHYLAGEEIATMLQNINSRLVIIQFTNEEEDLELKQKISQDNEAKKYFRTKEQLFALFKDFVILNAIEIDYKVTPEFYKNRLQINTDISHNEQIQIIELEKKK